jgi:hypothetical protein
VSSMDPERFTLRQAAQARDDFAQVTDELEFVKAQPACLRTRRDQAFVPLKIMFGAAVIGAALVILWLEAFLRHSLSGLELGLSRGRHGRLAAEYGESGERQLDATSC